MNIKSSTDFSTLFSFFCCLVTLVLLVIVLSPCFIRSCRNLDFISYLSISSFHCGSLKSPAIIICGTEYFLLSSVIISIILSSIYFLYFCYIYIPIINIRFLLLVIILIMRTFSSIFSSIILFISLLIMILTPPLFASFIENISVALYYYTG